MTATAIINKREVYYDENSSKWIYTDTGLPMTYENRINNDLYRIGRMLMATRVDDVDILNALADELVGIVDGLEEEIRRPEPNKKLFAVEKDGEICNFLATSWRTSGRCLQFYSKGYIVAEYEFDAFDMKEIDGVNEIRIFC